MTMSSPAGPMLVLLALGAAAVTWGMDDAQVGGVGQLPEPRLRDDQVFFLSRLKTIAVMEEAAPGSGRERAFDLAKRMLYEASNRGSHFSSVPGQVPRWSDDAEIRVGTGSGHYGYRLDLVRFVRAGGAVRAIRVTAVLPSTVKGLPGVSSRGYRVPESEFRALLRVAEALSGFQVAGLDSYWTDESATLAVWTSARVLGPSGVLFEEAFGAPLLRLSDSWKSARSEPLANLALLLLRDRESTLHRLDSSDRAWLRETFGGEGPADAGDFHRTWGIVFTAAGDAEYRRRTEYILGR